MPTYEYRCPKGHEFEKFYRTISSSELEVVCPECGVMAHRHMSVGAGLVFKGSGFYLTDYGKNAHATRGGAKASTSESDGPPTPPADAAATPPKPAADAGSAAPAPAPAADKGGGASNGGKSPPKRDT